MTRKELIAQLLAIDDHIEGNADDFLINSINFHDTKIVDVRGATFCLANYCITIVTEPFS